MRRAAFAGVRELNAGDGRRDRLAAGEGSREPRRAFFSRAVAGSRARVRYVALVSRRAPAHATSPDALVTAARFAAVAALEPVAGAGDEFVVRLPHGPRRGRRSRRRIVRRRGGGRVIEVFSTDR
jgi:hypothetical protein